MSTTTDDTNSNYCPVNETTGKNNAPVIVLMGVSGCGKTTNGRLLADKLNYTFIDADDFHPDANIRKMSAGQPLTETDRLPWLHILREEIENHLKTNTNIVLACSALKASYRAILCADSDTVKFVYLNGSFELIKNRLIQRQTKGEHWMKDTLLQSQFDTLEPPQDALWVEIDQSSEAIVEQIKIGLGV
jgi:gluconokinase